jgi:hypothetical protein
MSQFAKHETVNFLQQNGDHRAPYSEPRVRKSSWRHASKRRLNDFIPCGAARQSAIAGNSVVLWSRIGERFGATEL